MEEPPLEAGAVKEMLALVEFSEVAVPIIGADAALKEDVVIEFDRSDEGESPMALRAVTLKV